MRNPYEVLGVEVGASQSEIRKAYLNKMKQYHPDKNNGDKNAERMAQEINEAYEILSNSGKQDYARINLERKKKNAIDLIKNLVYISDARKKELINFIEQSTNEFEITRCVNKATIIDQQEKQKIELRQYKQELLSKLDKEMLTVYEKMINCARTKAEVDEISKKIYRNKHIKLLKKIPFISQKRKNEYLRQIINSKDEVEIQFIMSTAYKQNEETIKIFKQYNMDIMVSMLNIDEISLIIDALQDGINIKDIKEFLEIYLILKSTGISKTSIQSLSKLNISEFTRKKLEELEKTVGQETKVDRSYCNNNKKIINKNKIYNEKIINDKIKEEIIIDKYSDFNQKR